MLTSNFPQLLSRPPRATPGTPPSESWRCGHRRRPPAPERRPAAAGGNPPRRCRPGRRPGSWGKHRFGGYSGPIFPKTRPTRALSVVSVSYLIFVLCFPWIIRIINGIISIDFLLYHKSYNIYTYTVYVYTLLYSYTCSFINQEIPSLKSLLCISGFGGYII